MSVGSTKKRIRRTDEMLAVEARKFLTKTDFSKNSNAAYKAAWRRGPKFLDEICSHMEILWAPKWNTIEEVQEEALKYDERTSFARGSAGAYDKAQREGWLDIVCSFMGQKTNEMYSYEEVALEAKRFLTKQAFRKNSPGMWEAVWRRFDYKEICSHMKRSGDVSFKEQQLMDRIKPIFVSAKTLKDRRVSVAGKPWIKGFDIDIYVPEQKLGIEFDGEHWHSFKQLRKRLKKWPDEDVRNYHDLKDAWFWTSKGIRVYHVDERDWDLDPEACIKRCFEFLGAK